MSRAQPSVFLNVPFDEAYEPILLALAFTLVHCGYEPRCAKERNDGSETRISKICDLVAVSHLAVHDLSRTELDSGSLLPRFNMPFELGVYFGAKRFGGKRHAGKACLVFAREPHVYQAYISDIAGQDIQSHGNDPKVAAVKLRDWLVQFAAGATLPGGRAIWDDFETFQGDLPQLCAPSRRGHEELTYLEYVDLAKVWLAERGTADT